MTVTILPRAYSSSCLSSRNSDQRILPGWSPTKPLPLPSEDPDLLVLPGLRRANGTMSAPIDRQIAHLYADMLTKQFSGLSRNLESPTGNSPNPKLGTKRTVSFIDDQDHEAVIQRAIRKVRTELYAKFPHLEDMDENRGERIDNEPALIPYGTPPKEADAILTNWIVGHGFETNKRV